MTLGACFICSLKILSKLLHSTNRLSEQSNTISIQYFMIIVENAMEKRQRTRALCYIDESIECADNIFCLLCWKNTTVGKTKHERVKQRIYHRQNRGESNTIITLWVFYTHFLYHSNQHFLSRPDLRIKTAMTTTTATMTTLINCQRWIKKWKAQEKPANEIRKMNVFPFTSSYYDYYVFLLEFFLLSLSFVWHSNT